jgi:hypothetical protein
MSERVLAQLVDDQLWSHQVGSLTPISRKTNLLTYSHLKAQLGPGLLADDGLRARRCS